MYFARVFFVLNKKRFFFFALQTFETPALEEKASSSFSLPPSVYWTLFKCSQAFPLRFCTLTSDQKLGGEKAWEWGYLKPLTGERQQTLCGSKCWWSSDINVALCSSTAQHLRCSLSSLLSPRDADHLRLYQHTETPLQVAHCKKHYSTIVGQLCGVPNFVI